MHRRLRVATILALLLCIVASLSRAADPLVAPPAPPTPPQHATNQSLYRHEGGKTTLIPLESHANISFPFLKETAPPVTYAAQRPPEPAAPAAAGNENVALEMTGDLAREYCRLSGMPSAESGVQVQVIAAILARTKDGNVVIEHEGPTRTTSRLLLYGIVKEDKVTVTTTPAGARLFSSPRDRQPTLTKTETTTRTLKLNSTAGLTLRTLEGRK